MFSVATHSTMAKVENAKESIKPIKKIVRIYFQVVCEMSYFEGSFLLVRSWKLLTHKWPIKLNL